MNHLSNEEYSIWLSELKRKPKNPERVISTNDGGIPSNKQQSPERD